MGRIAEMKTEDMRKIIDSFIDFKNNKSENFIKEHEPQRIDTADDLKMCLGFAYVLYKRCYEKNIFDMRNTAAKYAFDIIQNNVKSEKAELYKDDELVQTVIYTLEFVFEEEYYYTDLVQTMKKLISFDSVSEKLKLEMIAFLVRALRFMTITISTERRMLEFRFIHRDSQARRSL